MLYKFCLTLEAWSSWLQDGHDRKKNDYIDAVFSPDSGVTLTHSLPWHPAMTGREGFTHTSMAAFRTVERDPFITKSSSWLQDARA